MLRIVKLFIACMMIVIVYSSLTAQDDTIIAKGLNNPRHITFDSDGTLYIAEAGKAGDIEGVGPFGAAVYGLTGQITTVSPDGIQSVLISDLASFNARFGQIYGPMAVHITKDSYWVVLGLGPEDLPEPQQENAVVEYDRSDLSINQIIDLRDFETQNNPDQNPDDLVSNPADLAVSTNGILYIVDASANDVLSWTEKEGLKVFAAWPLGSETAAVPTSIAVGSDGNIYIGFLSGFPFTPESARIDIYSSDGKFQKTYPGLSFITDIMLTSQDELYAVQFSSKFGDQGWEPNSGSVVKVTDDGTETIAEGLNFPYGIAESPEGNFVVTINSFGGNNDSGQAVVIQGD